MDKRLAIELKKVPFVPFRIVTTTGKSYEVTSRNSNFFYVDREQRILVVGSPTIETDPYFERDEFVSLLHVVRLEPMPLKESN